MCTIPDICYKVGLVCRYQVKSGRKYWIAIKRIMDYLKGNSDYSLFYQGGDTHLIGYIYADWGNDLDERKSTLGYVFIPT